jgi:transcriptional regulator with XRE-family HTH domain
MQPSLPWFRIRGADGLGRALARARRARKLSQEELAVRIGASRPTVARLETAPNSVIDRTVRAFGALGYDLVAVPRGATVTVAAAGDDE